MRFIFVIAAGLLLASGFALAQDVVPNGDFETWLSGAPVNWTTSQDFAPTSITQTSDAHSGNWAVQGIPVQVVPGFNLSAYLQSADGEAFPVSQRWGSLHGFYKLTSVGSDALYVTAGMYRNGSIVGVGVFLDSISTSSYGEFVAPIVYIEDSIPDSAYIYIVMFPGGGAQTVHLGSMFKIDDLVFSPDSGSVGECPIAVSGDASGDGEVKSSDIIYLINYVLKAGPAPLPCDAAGDANGDGEVKSSDIIYVVNYVLKAGPAPIDICPLIPSVWSCP